MALIGRAVPAGIRGVSVLYEGSRSQERILSIINGMPVAWPREE